MTDYSRFLTPSAGDEPRRRNDDREPDRSRVDVRTTEYASFLGRDAASARETTAALDVNYRAEVRRYGLRRAARMIGKTEAWLREAAEKSPLEMDDIIRAEKASRGQP